MAIDYTGGTNNSAEVYTGYAYGFPITITGNGDITSIGVNLSGVQAGNIRVSIYSAGVSKPSSLLAESASTAMNTSAGWQDVSVSYSITAGSYWVALQVSATKSVYYNAASRSYYEKAYEAFDASWSGSSSEDSAAQVNMRVTYTVGEAIPRHGFVNFQIPGIV